MKIAVILGSTRQNRSGERVAALVLSRLRLQQGVEAELLDLREYPLPFYAEAETPSDLQEEYQSPVANRWSKKIEEMDGFIIVAPEYNHGYSAVLKNALDYLYYPWNDKPVGFISYSSGLIGGARAVEQLRQVVGHLRLVAMQAAIHIGKTNDVIDENGAVISGPYENLIDRQIKEVLEWAAILREKRSALKG